MLSDHDFAAAASKLILIAYYLKESSYTKLVHTSCHKGKSKSKFAFYIL